MLGTVGLGVIATGYVWQIEPFWLEFVTKKMPIRNLPDALVGKTLMQISDIHIGNRFDYQYIIDSLVRAKEYEPDMVVYTGDYVTYESEEQLSQLKEVLPYFVKGKIGTSAILGNHDYGLNWSQPQVANTISSLLRDKGINVLRNEKVDFGGLQVVGLDDYWGANFDPLPALRDLDHSKANLVLCHNPDVCDLNVWQGYDGWVLAGHTHGGQCRPPFLPPPMLPVKNKSYDQGEISLDDGRTLYINRAIGHLYQVRCNVRPEITLFTLERA